MKFLLVLVACTAVAVLAKPVSPLEELMASTGLSIEQLKTLFKSQKQGSVDQAVDQVSASSEETVDGTDGTDSPASASDEEEVTAQPQGVPAKPKSRGNGGSRKAQKVQTASSIDQAIFDLA